MALDNIHVAVNNTLRSSGIDSCTKEELDNIFDVNGNYGQLFSNLHTHYQQMKYCRSHLKYVVSRQSQHQIESVLYYYYEV